MKDYLISRCGLNFAKCGQTKKADHETLPTETPCCDCNILDVLDHHRSVCYTNATLHVLSDRSNHHHYATPLYLAT